MAYYVLDANKNLKEALDKEGVYAVLEQAIEDGDLEHVAADSAFVSKIKDLNGGQDFKVWIGTTAEYNAIQEKTQNTLYLLTDDELEQELSDIEDNVTTLFNEVENIEAYIPKKIVQVVNINENSYQLGTSLTFSIPTGKSFSDIMAISVNFSSWNVSQLLATALDPTGQTVNFGGVSASINGSGQVLTQMNLNTLVMYIQQQNSSTGVFQINNFGIGILNNGSSPTISTFDSSSYLLTQTLKCRIYFK